jgi:hypothetical protein
VTVLSDSSPLITLAKIGRLDLLPQLYEKVTITPEVYAEVVVSGAGLAGSSQISAAKWIDVKPVQWWIAQGHGVRTPSDASKGRENDGGSHYEDDGVDGAEAGTEAEETFVLAGCR